MTYDDMLFARHTAVQAIGGAVLAQAGGAAPGEFPGFVELARDGQDPASPELQGIADTVIRCLAWAAITVSAAEDREAAQLRPLRESDLLRELDRLPPLTPGANKILGHVTTARDVDHALRRADSLVDSGTMSLAQLVSAAFEATTALIGRVAAKHGFTTPGNLCILLGHMNVWIDGADFPASA